MAGFWDELYEGRDYLFGTAPNAFLARQAPRLRAGQSALAVADGEGRNGVWLARQGLHVTAIDSSAVGLRKAALLAAEHCVVLDLRHADIAGYDWPEAAFDVVVAIFIQFAGPDLRAAMFDGMIRTLAPGGLLLLEGYRPEQLAYGTGGPRQPENLYDRPMLEAAFAELEILELESYDAEITEGPGHVGQSALIDLVGRKPG